MRKMTTVTTAYHCGFVLCDRNDEHVHSDSALLSKHCDVIDELVEKIARVEALCDDVDAKERVEQGTFGLPWAAFIDTRAVRAALHPSAAQPQQETT